MLVILLIIFLIAIFIDDITKYVVFNMNVYTASLINQVNPETISNNINVSLFFLKFILNSTPICYLYNELFNIYYNDKRIY